MGYVHVGGRGQSQVNKFEHAHVGHHRMGSPRGQTSRTENLCPPVNYIYGNIWIEAKVSISVIRTFFCKEKYDIRTWTRYSQYVLTVKKGKFFAEAVKYVANRGGRKGRKTGPYGIWPLATASSCFLLGTCFPCFVLFLSKNSQMTLPISCHVFRWRRWRLGSWPWSGSRPGCAIPPLVTLVAPQVSPERLNIMYWITMVCIYFKIVTVIAKFVRRRLGIDAKIW